MAAAESRVKELLGDIDLYTPGFHPKGFNKKSHKSIRCGLGCNKSFATLKALEEHRQLPQFPRQKVR